jgi:hypothetical protein
MKYTNLIFIRHGMFSKGSVPISPRVLSLTVLIECYASLMCSFAAMLLHSTVGSIFVSFSNSPSINIVLTLKPALLYTCRTQSKCLARLLAILTGTCSAVMNLICWGIVNKKAVPSTKNTSAAIVITLLDPPENKALPHSLPPRAPGLFELSFL